MALTVSRPMARSGVRSSIRGSFAVRAASASRPELQARGDRPADVRPVRAHAVERRRRPEVHDHRRGAVQAGGGEGVDQPVRPDLVGAVDPDRQRHVAGRTRRGPGSHGAPRRPASSRSARGRPRRPRSPDTSAIVRSSSPIRPASSSSSSSAVARPGRPGAARRHELPVRDERERDVRVPDVEREQHARIIRVRPPDPRVRSRSRAGRRRGVTAADGVNP